MNTEKKVFLVINTGYLGDVILTSKLTRDIKKEYPNSFLIFIVDTPYFSIAKGLPGVDEVINYDRKKCQNFFNLLKFVMKFPYRNKIDYTFIPDGRKSNRLVLAKLLGSKNNFTLFKFQYSPKFVEYRTNNPLLNRFTCQSANLLSCLTDKTTDNQDIEYIVPKEAEEKIDKYLKDLNSENNLIAINPKAGDNWKCWNINEVVEFVKMMILDGKKIVLTGILKDGQNCIKALNESIGENNYINLVGQTSIPELGALYKRCEAVISVDTGSMHMACAVGTPTVALFFKDNYNYWGPFNLERNSLLYNPDGINAPTVYKEVKNLLKI